jgi:hypothetical protein
LPALATELENLSLVINIGEMPVRVNTTDPVFLHMLEDRYAGYLGSPKTSAIAFDVELCPPMGDPDADMSVEYKQGVWKLQRGDFRAEWNPAIGHGLIRQFRSPYSMDAVLRILHSLLLAREGGVLLHSASAIRNGRAFLFAGVSGAGKTTISRLAPNDVTLLTDEISYVRRRQDRYIAYGTPFTGELAKLGENVSAPIATLYLLAQGTENRIDRVPAAEAVRSLLANVLFFAEESDAVQSVFGSAFDFVSRVPVCRLTFVPDARVWELIR